MDAELKACLIRRQPKPHTLFPKAYHIFLKIDGCHNIHEVDKPEYAPHGLALNRSMDKFRGGDRRESRMFRVIHVQGFDDLESEVCFWGRIRRGKE